MDQVKLERKRVYHVLGEIEESGKYSVGYFLNFDDANQASKNRGLLDGDGDIETVTGLVVNDIYLFVEETSELLPLYHDDLTNLKEQVLKKINHLRQTASTKLTQEERIAIGL